MRSLITLTCLFFLYGCATQVSTLKSGEHKTLKSGKGFILLGVETNANLNSIYISGPQSIKLTHSDIKEGTNFLFVDLKAGKYKIDRVAIGKNRNLRLKQDDISWDLQIESGKISYVGHFEWKTHSYSRYYSFWSASYFVELVNRSSEALEFLEKEHPLMLSQNSLVYGGPGKDYFYSFLRESEVK